MPSREFQRSDLTLDSTGCYSWCACEGGCAARRSPVHPPLFNRYDGRDVLCVLNTFARDQSVPWIAFAVGELLLAGMCATPRTPEQVVEWLAARWKAGG